MTFKHPKIKPTLKFLAAVSTTTIVLVIALLAGVHAPKALADKADCEGQGGTWVAKQVGPSGVAADSCEDCPTGTITTGETCKPGLPVSADEDVFTTNPAGNDCKTAGSDNCIEKDIQLVINALSAGVGLVITLVIIVAGLQYMTARDNPQAVQAAKGRIINAVIALIAFVFIWAFLQWIVPGGVL